ncbi:YIP1 family protein [Aquibacillus saliphilus]|uniref:YIP1 family protein n=1 Tax=Aquibacillus saliphilus TaxID=1909422 RepID=UPI001CEFCCD1|nr:YIP1 family protein [Aquibacillus saliphilus]
MTTQESLLKFWIQPGRVINNEVDRNTRKVPIIIVLLSGIYDFLMISQSNNHGDQFSLSSILLMASLIGPLIGYLSYLVGSWITDLIAGWFNGDRDLRGFRIAYAWAHLPVLVNLVAILPFILSKKEAFFLEGYAPLLYLIIDGLLIIPYTVYFIIAIKTFYNFSWWKAIVVYALPAFILAGLILIMSLPFIFA